MMLYVKIIQVIFVRMFYILGSLYLLESYIYYKFIIKLLMAWNIIGYISYS